MSTRKRKLFWLLLLMALTAGCSVAGKRGLVPLPIPGTESVAGVVEVPTATWTAAAGATVPNDFESTKFPPTSAPAATATEPGFGVGEELTIQYLRDLEITGSEILFEEELEPTFYYERHLVSYVSEGNTIYGLLTIPRDEPSATGFKAIVFNHGYIPPGAYRTTDRYTAYVDYLARSGFVVFKIDYRGHGRSEGEPTGSYFSPGYTIDSVAALKGLQRLEIVDPHGIGIWGHSMAGNLTLRAMLIEPEVAAGVIWAGAVYSYDDFAEYGIDDNTYRPPEPDQEGRDPRRRSRQIFAVHGRPDTRVDYWRAVSLTENIGFLNSPLQIHHAEDDPVVSIAYSEGLVTALQEHGKTYEFYRYEGGGHNLVSPYFVQAMQRTVEFFRRYL